MPPSVVRFRPFDKSQKVDRASLLSVRFTESMDHASTAKAFTVTAGGKRVAGTTAWAEKSHVLVFRPSAPLAYGTTVVMSVGPAATSRAGVPVQAASATFRVVPKPAPAAKPKPAHTGGSGSVKRQPISHSGGSGAVAGSWHAVESYYLRLMNCTRTGGWVTSGGSCSSPGGRNVKPLVLSENISAMTLPSSGCWRSSPPLPNGPTGWRPRRPSVAPRSPACSTASSAGAGSGGSMSTTIAAGSSSRSRRPDATPASADALMRDRIEVVLDAVPAADRARALEGLAVLGLALKAHIATSGTSATTPAERATA